METPTQVVLKVILQNRRGTEEEWRKVNPIIEEAVIVYSTDVKKNQNRRRRFKMDRLGISSF